MLESETTEELGTSVGEAGGSVVATTDGTGINGDGTCCWQTALTAVEQSVSCNFWETARGRDVLVP